MANCRRCGQWYGKGHQCPPKKMVAVPTSVDEIGETSLDDSSPYSPKTVEPDLEALLERTRDLVEERQQEENTSASRRESVQMAARVLQSSNIEKPQEFLSQLQDSFPPSNPVRVEVTYGSGETYSGFLLKGSEGGLILSPRRRPAQDAKIMVGGYGDSGLMDLNVVARRRTQDNKETNIEEIRVEGCGPQPVWESSRPTPPYVKPRHEVVDEMFSGKITQDDFDELTRSDDPTVRLATIAACVPNYAEVFYGKDQHDLSLSKESLARLANDPDPDVRAGMRYWCEQNVGLKLSETPSFKDTKAAQEEKDNGPTPPPDWLRISSR